MCFLEESYEKMQTIQILTILRAALYSKSGSMPLSNFKLLCVDLCTKEIYFLLLLSQLLQGMQERQK